jgi:hypothetical protein
MKRPRIPGWLIVGRFVGLVVFLTTKGPALVFTALGWGAQP